MKAVMYHYVRHSSPDSPYFTYLDLDDFRRQLDYFQRKFGYVRKSDFIESLATGKAPEGVLLTFDDGLSDHYRFVFPELEKRGLWGIFYIPTLPLAASKFIDVHCTHLLLGKHGGVRLLEAVKKNVTDELMKFRNVTEFTSLTYLGQKESQAINSVKRILNYYLEDEERTKIVNHLMVDFFPNYAAIFNDFYMTEEQISLLHSHGMVVGSHSHTHPVMSKLSKASQQDEISKSFDVIESMLGVGQVDTYCHPYGGSHTYNEATLSLLSQSGCKYAFSVENRDISDNDLVKGKYFLPRYDCNYFPHGQISRG